MEDKVHNFILKIEDLLIPLTCFISRDGYAYSVASDDQIRIYDCIKDACFKIRRKDNRGEERYHDARLYFSNVDNNGNAELSIEFSDLYVSIKDIAIAAAYITHDNRIEEPISYMDEDVLAIAISNKRLNKND